MSHLGATRGGSTDLDAGTRGCPVSEKVDLSSEECAMEGLSQGKSVLGTRYGWASKAQLAGPAPRPP